MCGRVLSSRGKTEMETDGVSSVGIGCLLCTRLCVNRIFAIVSEAANILSLILLELLKSEKKLHLGPLSLPPLHVLSPGPPSILRP